MKYSLDRTAQKVLELIKRMHVAGFMYIVPQNGHLQVCVLRISASGSIF